MSSVDMTSFIIFHFVYYFSCLIALARTSSAMLNRSDWSGDILDLFLILGEKTFSISPFSPLAKDRFMIFKYYNSV